MQQVMRIERIIHYCTSSEVQRNVTARLRVVRVLFINYFGSFVSFLSTTDSI